MAINNTESELCMKATTNHNRSLLHMENLTLPPVVVIAANMRCNGCRGRVFRVVSRMTGLTEYTVDLQKREVTIKGDFMANCNLQDESIRSSSLLSAKDEPKSLSTFLAHSH
ncbi:copper transport protein CCH isoform X2 [Vigna unguiculata]|uniref:copper transport protein CCH isoform X2 n=1 Tax=Vigna unguiculata TaxID=3917 RepID=UPI001016A856|nr:copper transport protein CCH isoform X2 [Vigna unguiculata]